MHYELLATLTIFIHFAFIVFAILGGLLSLINYRWCYLHLPALCWGVLVEVNHWQCPLSPLENWFRDKAGLSIYEGNFIDYYLSIIVYPPSLTPQHQVAMGVSLLLINLVIYGFVWKRRRK